jgi:Tfp pilus assembly ATPase PilU
MIWNLVRNLLMPLKKSFDPLVVIVGATGTGKSQVHPIIPSKRSRLMTVDSLPSN